MVSKQIEERLGVFKSIDEVPEHYRLRSFSSMYSDDKVWDEWDSQHSDTDWKRTESARVKERWEAHQQSRGRHIALATPKDVEAWVRGLREEISLERTYKPYWLFVKRFYHWLMWHTQHPHRYNPVLLSVANHPTSREIWDYVMSLDRETFRK